MKLTIRPYSDQDFASVTALEESGIHESYRSAVFVRQMGEVCKETFFVAVLNNGEPVGYSVGARVQHDSYQAWILRLGVREDQRRRGVGTALLKAVTDALQTEHTCTIRAVRVSIQPACNQTLRESGVRCGEYPSRIFWPG